MKNFLLFLTIIALISCKNEQPSFDKIYYHTTTCFGTCPEYYIEINRDKTFKLFAKTVFKENTSYFDLEFDSLQMGYFKGKIDEKIYQKLDEQIKIISSKDYKYDRNQMITDTPEITLIVQRGADKTCFQTFYPTENFQNNVINLLNSICETSQMEKTEKFNIEKNACR